MKNWLTQGGYLIPTVLPLILPALSFILTAKIPAPMTAIPAIAATAAVPLF